MNKLHTYIKQGQGNGLIFLLLTSVIITTIFMMSLKTTISSLQPQIELIAQDFLPIEIKNNQIISPKDTYKEVILDLTTKDDKEKILLPIILNTKTTSEELPKHQYSIYLNQNNIHFITPDKIQKKQYVDGVYDAPTFKSLLKKTNLVASIIFSIIMIGILFINFGVKTLILSYITKCLIRLITQTTPVYSSLMRLSALSISFTELVGIISSNLISYPLNGAILITISGLIVAIYIYNELKDTPPHT